jgi:hypothetical protein
MVCGILRDRVNRQGLPWFAFAAVSPSGEERTALANAEQPLDLLWLPLQEVGLKVLYVFGLHPVGAIPTDGVAHDLVAVLLAGADDQPKVDRAQLMLELTF